MNITTCCPFLKIVPVLILVLFFQIHADKKQNTERQIKRLITNGAVVLHDESGNILISYNKNRLLIPASILKIFTSAVALDVLGKDYRFKTDFYIDSLNNLAIKGWGDPFLISEEIDCIAKELKQRGVSSINRLYLDHTSFGPLITIPGVSRTQNPYDAINGALVVNFNTLNISKDAHGTISSGEEVTPLTPLAILKGASVHPGTKQRINLSSNSNDCLAYTAELFTAFMKKAGITVDSQQFSFTTVQSGTWNLLYTHYNTNDIVAVSRALQKYSNNFIANQIFLTIGAVKIGYPAHLEKSKSVFEEYIRTKTTIPSDQLIIHEGSGISRNNRLTAGVMMQILEKYREHADLLPEKKSALVKSGTLSGVYNYAGYIKTGKGLRPFVIILNQKDNYRDTILDLLISYCSEN